ncbi:MAG: IgA Peptidase M64 [Thermoanaerobaculia bacterium]
MAAGAAAEPPRTARLDYYHTGSASEEIFSFDRLVVEPLPWPGNPDRPVDDTNLGKYLFEVRRPESGELLYSRGFASIYGEWETTGEAKKRHRTFHESLRFPLPDGPVEVVLKKRDAQNVFQEVWRTEADPGDMLTDTSLPPLLFPAKIQHTGPSEHKVDLLLLGDGYTAEECAKFVKQALRLSEVLFSMSPFSERRNDFNVWALCPPAAESGISRPSTGVHRRSPARVTYDAFRSERYVLAFDNRAWRDLAAWAPYEFVEILVNNETYGGGGIFGLYSTAAAANDWADYVFIHEFGHHFAGLADEYYTSPVAYEIPEEQVEPWEVNATVDPAKLKWAELVEEGTPVPTPWPKQEFEVHAKMIQERRQRIRAENRPESEMSALFSEQQAFETELLGEAEHAGKVGAFEGANYAPLGSWRPQADCVMFSRNKVPFCKVCQRGIEQVIDLYTAETAPSP